MLRIIAPAQSAIRYETITFNAGKETERDQSPYIGISDAADAAWDELDLGMSLYKHQTAEF